MNDFKRRMNNSYSPQQKTGRGAVSSAKKKYSLADFLDSLKPSDSDSIKDRARIKKSLTGSVALVRKHKPDYLILVLSTLLVMIGIIIIFAIGPQRSNILNITQGSTLQNSHFVLRQIVYVVISVATFALMATFPVRVLIDRFKWQILGLSLLFCVILLLLGNLLHVSSITQCALGACRWFILPGLGTFQPAEFLKLGVLIFLAGFLGTRMQTGDINDKDKTIVPFAILLAVCMFFVIVAQKDLGSGVALTSIFAAMLFAAGFDKQKMALAIGILLAAGVLLIAMAPHRIDRVLTFMKGDEASVSDPSAYHSVHARIAIGSGGLLGVGIGNSVQAAGYLPEAINDSVFGILGETFGFVGLALILAIYFFLLMRFLKIFDHVLDPKYKLIVIGVFGWIGSHVIINVSSMIGIIPLTGITLPFLSFGGTSMMFMAAILGLVFQISRYTVHNAKLMEVKSENPSGRRGVGRTRYASRRSA